MLHHQQFGFCSNHSTVHTIHMVDTIQKAIDSRNYYYCGIFKDLCKSFDTADHHMLENSSRKIQRCLVYNHVSITR